ncbi:MAG: hypothetical protein ACP5SD_10200 [Elusimicrobiales bacterium]
MRKINDIILKDFLDKLKYDADFFILELKLKPPPEYSFERLCFLNIGVSTLFEYFFSIQTFEESLSEMIKRKMEIIPKNLRAPNENEKKEFAKQISFNPKIERFLKSDSKDIPLSGYLKRIDYLDKIKELRRKEITEYSDQKGKELTESLRKHFLKLSGFQAFQLWKEFAKEGGEWGYSLRSAWLEGYYHMILEDNDFKKFILDEKTYAGIDAFHKKYLYESIVLRNYCLDESEKKKLIELITYYLKDYEEDYKQRLKETDLIWLFSSDTVSYFLKLYKDLARDLVFSKDDFFYVKDFDSYSSLNFKKFDEKVELVSKELNEFYKEKNVSDIDLWKDYQFKFLYLMIAVLFKNFWNERFCLEK